MAQKNYKKFVATAATATLVASALVPVASADVKVSASDFSDVSKDYKEAVEYLVALGANGVSTTQFGISHDVKRGDAAIFLASALGILDENAPASGFTDVPARAEVAVNSLKAAGIVNGKTATSFGVNDSLKRGEVALMLANANAYDLKGDASKLNFTDVSSRYTEAVAGMVEAGVTSGITATQFGTDLNIKRGDLAKFLFGLKDELEVGAPEVVSVSAITSKSVQVTFTGNPEGLTAQDFNVTGGLTVVDVKVAGKTATISFSRDMVDGADYELQLLDEEGEVSSKASFKYVLGQVANIAITKSQFEIGESVSKFLKVFDDKGVEISTADYNVVGVESSNTAVVGNTVAALVANVGTANLRFTIEYKDGSRSTSDFIRVDVDTPVTAAVAGFELDDTGASFENTVDYRNNGSGAKTSLFVSDADQYLFVYADDSKTNPEIAPLNLVSGGDYTVTTKTPTVVTVAQDGTGALLTPVAKGKATIEITGPNNYKKTVTVEVKEDPIFKDLLVGVSSLKLSDESVGAPTLGVDQEVVTLEWLDQHGVKRDLAVNPNSTGLTGTAVNTSAQEQVLTDVIVPGDKVVISSTATAFNLEDVATGDSEVTVTAVQDKTVSNASVRVSYYADANNNRATTQKTIATSVVDVDATKAAYDYETLVTNPAIDAFVPSKDTTIVTAYAVDKNKNRIADVTGDVVLDFSSSVSVSEGEWFDLSALDNTATFAANSWKFMTEEGALKLDYTVAGASDPHGTVTIAYSNSFAAPNKAVTNTSPVLVDVSAAGDFSTGITVEELLFGKILEATGTPLEHPGLVIDTVASAPSGSATAPSIAIKKGFTGYANTPVLSFLDKSGKAVVSGAGLYGLDVAADTNGNGYLVLDADGTYDADTQFEVEYTITNDTDLTQTAGVTNLDNVLTVATGEDQAAFTIVVTKVTVAGDPRVNNAGVNTAKNLLDAPKSVNVILKN